MKNKIVSVGILTIVFAVFAVVAIPISSAQCVYYLVPDDSNVEGYGNTADVQLRLNATQEIQTGGVTIMYDPSCAKIELAGFTFDPEWEMKTGASYPGEYLITFGNEDDYGIPVNLSVGDYLIGTYTIQCNSTSPCVTDLNFVSSSPHCSVWATDLAAIGVVHVPFVTDNGIFTCGYVVETFTKPLPSVGWNLISLPLTPLDNSTSEVLSSMSEKYDAVYSFDADTKDFVDVSSGTMDPGIGYFVHVTTAGTWTYNGIAKTSMSVPLEQGLNMVGWLNCSKSISDGLSSIDGNYYYVARWNAAEKKFETYNPVAPTGFNDFSDMNRGEGYFISAKAESTLSESC